jgi:putative ABC transport system permease protein
VNRALLEKFGWTPEEALGQQIRLYTIENETIYQDVAGAVIGVVENYHVSSLRQEIPPVVYRPAKMPGLKGDDGGYQLDTIVAKVAPGSAGVVMDALRSAWTTVLPDTPFQASFLDDQLQTQYRGEQQLGQIVGVFSVLAILVACLGLFGLAILVGTPLAYLAVDWWLQDFAYHVSLGPLPTSAPDWGPCWSQDSPSASTPFGPLAWIRPGPCAANDGRPHRYCWTEEAAMRSL